MLYIDELRIIVYISSIEKMQDRDDFETIYINIIYNICDIRMVNFCHTLYMVLIFMPN